MRIPVYQRWLFVIVFLVGIIWIVFHLRAQETWDYLRDVDPSLQILEDPKTLLSIAASDGGFEPEPKDRFHNSKPLRTRHEALRALLNLQERKFGVTLKADRTGTSIEGIWVERLPSKVKGQIRILATPSQYADIEAKSSKVDDLKFFSREIFTFDQNGRLLERIPAPLYP